MWEEEGWGINCFIFIKDTSEQGLNLLAEQQFRNMLLQVTYLKHTVFSKKIGFMLLKNLNRKAAGCRYVFRIAAKFLRGRMWDSGGVVDSDSDSSEDGGGGLSMYTSVGDALSMYTSNNDSHPSSTSDQFVAEGPGFNPEPAQRPTQAPEWVSLRERLDY